MSRKYILVISALCVLLCRCSGDRQDVDVSGIEVNTDLKRLDVALFRGDTENMKQVNKALMRDYGTFYTYYLGDIIQQGSPYDPMVDFNLGRFVNDIVMQDVYVEIEKVFADVGWLQEELEGGLTYFKYHFPDVVVPQIVTYHSGFNYGAYCTDSVIGVGLEMYLGPTNEMVLALPAETFPKYVKSKMDRKYLVVDAMTSWIQTNFYTYRPSLSFLESIVEMGKIIYTMDAVLPEIPDHVKMHYEEDQLAWCLANEENIWKEIINQDLLFSKDENEIFKYIADGPFTTGLPRESPARVGSWLGWRIVKSYMDANPGISLKKMLENQDAESILKFYKPDR